MTADTPPVLAPALNRRSVEMTKLVRTAGYIVIIIALVAAAATFFVLLGLTAIEPTQEVVVTALTINGALALLLVLIVGWEVARLVTARRRGRAAARLHIRIVALFSVVAALPAILVAIVASITLDRGLDNWFSTSTRAIIANSRAVAQAFVDQQVGQLDRDVVALKNELEKAQSLLGGDADRFQDYFSVNAARWQFPGAFVVNGAGEVVQAARSGTQSQFPPPPREAIEQAGVETGQPALITPGSANMVGGVIKLHGYDDLYLYALRPIAPEVLRQIAMAADSANQFRALEETRTSIQLAFGILYLGVALIVLLAAIWLGIAFANRLVSPIRKLIDAAKQVSTGNLAVRVPVRHSEGDLGALGDTFNTMTGQLKTQREELLSANSQIDSRRRFTEAVLSGVTAGVIGIDRTGRVTIANRSAIELTGTTSDALENQPIIDVIPELSSAVANALRGRRSELRDQVTMVRGGRERTINVRVTSEGAGEDIEGYVITLDDITDLVSAQRSSAWADVARRIAHEIKNPLTPIQLSAERLKRKFGKSIDSDREIFEQCTDTIVRQVGDIGRMVDEFSSFARTPKPTIAEQNLSDPIKEAVFLLEVAHPEISFSLELPDEPLIGAFDSRLMSQAFTNIVKNGTEAIAALPIDERDNASIRVNGRRDGDMIVVDVIDTGIGLPAEGRQRLLEPYMTTREKGTGLGLAIVTKIIEEHGGRIELLDSPEVARGGRGAMVRIRIPANVEGAPELAARDSGPARVE